MTPDRPHRDSAVPTPPRGESGRTDPDDLGNEAGWDPEAVTVARPHYPYDQILWLDTRIRLLSAGSLLPWLCTVVLIGLEAFRNGFECLSLLCPLFLLLPLAGRLEGSVFWLVFAALDYVLLLSGGIVISVDGVQRGNAGTLAEGLCLAVTGLLGPAAWLGALILKGRVRNLHLPDDLPQQVGALLQPSAARTWVALQREADLAEQSIGWGGEPPAEPDRTV